MDAFGSLARLYDAGFDVVDALGDYRAHPFGPRSPRLILQAVRLP